MVPHGSLLISLDRNRRRIESVRQRFIEFPFLPLHIAVAMGVALDEVHSTPWGRLVDRLVHGPDMESSRAQLIDAISATLHTPEHHRSYRPFLFLIAAIALEPTPRYGSSTASLFLVSARTRRSRSPTGNGTDHLFSLMIGFDVWNLPNVGRILAERISGQLAFTSAL